MRTATYDRALRAVPEPQQKAQFAFLLAVRRRAHQALDALLALPRAGAGWALRHLRNLIDAAADHRGLGWVGARLRRAATLAGAVGVVPLFAAALSTPGVWARTVRLAQAGGSAALTLGRALWSRTRGLLERGGPTGQRAARALANAGTAAATSTATVVSAVATSPVRRPVLHLLTLAGGLVRPVSHALVGHRLIRLLPAARWVHLGLELLVLPLLVATTMPASRPGAPPLTVAEQPRPTQAPTDDPTNPSQEFPMTRLGADPAREITDPALAPANRAQRRAQQQEQARARRASTRH